MPERQPITDQELRTLVDNEIRESMGELSGELADERARAMDYYHGEPVGKLAAPSSDRSSVVMTTVRDTVEWLKPELMRVFAKADKVVEFQPVSAEDEQQAEQETQAVNHIFWRQNNGFLLLYTAFTDALLQKTGVFKWWIEESEHRTREEYDGLTDIKLQQLEADPDLEAIEREPSEVPSLGGMPLHHVVFERVAKRKRIKVEVIPPEEFLISGDARSLNIAEDMPRFVGHYTEKTQTELLEMGFSPQDVELMARGGGEFVEQWDEEYFARYNLTDEQQHIYDTEGHESQRKIKLVEGYMQVDKDGDGYAELLKVWRAGDFCQDEECDQIPFSAITPNILSHKFYGMSIADMVEDLQEIATTVLRSGLDNLYQTNNMRPIINKRVDLDSLLVSRPGAPIYVDDQDPVQGAVEPFAPPPMWKDMLPFMEWQDGVRKDRTGVGDEVMGLDPQTLSNANTGVVMQAFEAARSKIELIARIFAETGIKWLFQGIHELCRKSYDQPLRYKLRNQYVEVQPTEWLERDDITVSVGTATGSEQRELAALQRIGELQQAMIAAGGLGVTVIPSNVHKMSVDTIEAMGKKDAESYFFDPMLRQNPQVMQLVQAQLPQQQDPSSGLIQANMQIEQGKSQVEMAKAQMQAQLKQAELMLKREEMGLKADVERMKADMGAMTKAAEQGTEIQKAQMKLAVDKIGQAIKAMEVSADSKHDALSTVIDKYRADIAAFTTLETKRMEIAQRDYTAVMEAEQRVSETAQHATDANANIGEVLGRVNSMMDAIHKDMLQRMAAFDDMKARLDAPKVIKRDVNGHIVSVGDQPVVYDETGNLSQIG